MLSLAHPAWLAVGAILIAPYFLRRQRAWHYSNTRLLEGAQRLGAPGWFLTATTGIALSLLVIALSRPLKGMEYAEEVLETRDILLALDLSLSMEGFLNWEGDQMPPTKLELIRDAALEFVRQNQHDRLGLIVFGDDAFGVWPLSVDSRVLQGRLKRLDTLLPPALRGTHVARALERSLSHFDEMEQSDSKILLLLTDGLDSIDPAVHQRLVQRLKQNGIKLYVLGMQLSENTSIVKLVRELKGGYFNINNADELSRALRTIDQQEPAKVVVHRATESRELYAYFALPGMLLLLLSTACRSAWVWDV
jgi:Ca-activated chloride channel family protein